jgi:hypothetical protein
MKNEMVDLAGLVALLGVRTAAAAQAVGELERAVRHAAYATRAGHASVVPPSEAAPQPHVAVARVGRVAPPVVRAAATAAAAGRRVMDVDAANRELQEAGHGRRA